RLQGDWSSDVCSSDLEVTVLPTRRQLKLEFGFTTPGYTNPDQPPKEAEEERSMVTGDLNAALVEWVVQYRIDDPKQYLFDVRNQIGRASCRERVYSVD